MQPMATRNPAQAAPKAKATRRYTNTRRTAQAAQTRADVLAAAVELFNEQGWAATTIAAIAERAGVAVETVYSGFGSKKALLQQAADTTVVGDAEPVALFDRPEIQALGTGPLDDRFRRAIAQNFELQKRGARVMRACQEAASADSTWDAWVLEKTESRRLDTKRILELMLETELDPVTLELLMVLYSPETYLFLIEHSGWTRAEYEAHLIEATLALIRSRQPEP